MGLAIVKNFGYGMDGKTLDLTIAIPKGSYLKHFWIANQNDIQDNNSTKVGLDYIKAIQNMYKSIDTENAFKKLFEYLGDYTCKETGNIYDLYKLNQDCMWSTDKSVGIGVKVSQNDLTFITMEVYLSNQEASFKVSTQCGEDNTVTIFPLYNLLAIRLKALSYAQFLNGTCTLPADFIDKILQIKAIELATLSEDYYKASTYWNKFYKGTNKRCNCHG